MEQKKLIYNSKIKAVLLVNKTINEKISEVFKIGVNQFKIGYGFDKNDQLFVKIYYYQDNYSKFKFEGNSEVWVTGEQQISEKVKLLEDKKVEGLVHGWKYRTTIFDISTPIQIHVIIDVIDVVSDNQYVISNYGNVFNNKTISDLVIKCGDTEFYASKAILSSHSDVFLKMFSNELSESQTNELIIDDNIANDIKITDENVFEFLRFIYFDHTDRLDEMKLALLHLAEKYQINDLKAICQEYIFLELNCNNAIQCLILFDRYNCNEMKNKTSLFIARKFDIILECAKQDLDHILDTRRDLLDEIYKALANIVQTCKTTSLPITSDLKYFIYRYLVCV